MTEETTKYPSWAVAEADARIRLVASIAEGIDSIARINGAKWVSVPNQFEGTSRDDRVRHAIRYGTVDGRGFNSREEFSIRERGIIEMDGPGGKKYAQEMSIAVTNKRSYPNGQLHATVTFDYSSNYVAKTVTRGGRGRHGMPKTRKYDVVCQKLVGKSQDLRNLFGAGVTRTVRDVIDGMQKKLTADSSVEAVAGRMRAVLEVEAPIAFDGEGTDATYTYTVDYGQLAGASAKEYYAKYKRSLEFRFNSDGRVMLRNFDSYHSFTEDEFARIAAVVREALERRQNEEIIKGL